MERILFLTAAAAAVSCVQIDGGAVEASWVLRTEDGRAISGCGCADPPIAGVRFTLVGASGDVTGTSPCQGRAACQFSCERQTGATPFDIPPGYYLMSLGAVDAVGQPIGSVQAPAPILRQVVHGQPTQLDALALVTRCAPSCSLNQNGACKR